jgi:DNA-binding transcriptional ArsR family regulator
MPLNGIEANGSFPDNESSNGAVVKAADLLRALANPHRLMILRLLRSQPRTVMDICTQLDLRQSLVSQHLARLRLDGVVTAMRQGHFVIYSMTNETACRVFDTILGSAPRTEAATGHMRP